MSLSMFCGLWIIAPMLSADCISREKREGTLGLLFLTPLKAFDVVVAKIMAQTLRTGTLLVAALPVMLLPVLTGGVSWMDGVRAVLLNLSALFIALSIGVVASTFCRRWVTAVIVSVLLSAGSACLFVWAYILARLYPYFARGNLDFRSYALNGGRMLEQIMLRIQNFVGAFNSAQPFGPQYSGRFPVRLWSTSSGADLTSVIISGSLFGISLIGILAVLILAAIRLNRFWKDHPASRRQLWLLKVFCSPIVWKQSLKRMLNRRLNQNPILWLETYSWNARLTTWGWLLAVIIIELVMLQYYFFLSQAAQRYYAGVLAIGMAFTAVSSFRRERETRLLELLLVTPLNEISLIGGRLLGIWRQFFLSFLLIIFAGFFLELQAWNTMLSGVDYQYQVFSWTTTLFAVSAIGSFFSLTRLNLLVSWGITCLLGLFMPLRFAQWIYAFVYYYITGWPGNYSPDSIFLRMMIDSMLIQLLLGIGALVLLHRKLKRRAFQFD